jgi:hypothetical protein
LTKDLKLQWSKAVKRVQNVKNAVNKLKRGKNTNNDASMSAAGADGELKKVRLCLHFLQLINLHFSWTSEVSLR